MKIHRSYPQERFTMIPNETLRDPRLSYLARGVLAEILSRPDDWATTADAIWGRARRERGKEGEGRGVVRAAFAELAAAGYLHRERRRFGRGRFVTELHVFDAPDGLEAWQAAEAFRAGAVDNYPPPDVSAGGTDDDTGSGRSDQGKHASSQVAPTTGPPTAGRPVVGRPVAGQPVVFTETYDGDLNTETYDGDRDSTENPPVLTSPVPVEGARARRDQDRFISDEDWEQRERLAARVLGPLPQAAP